jgi:hypothetical protein
MSQKTHAKIQVVIYWLTVSEKCYINMGQTLNCCVVMTAGKGKNLTKYADHIILNEETNQLHSKHMLIMLNT